MLTRAELRTKVSTLSQSANALCRHRGAAAAAADECSTVPHPLQPLQQCHCSSSSSISCCGSSANKASVCFCRCSKRRRAMLMIGIDMRHQSRGECAWPGVDWRRRNKSTALHYLPAVTVRLEMRHPENRAAPLDLPRYRDRNRNTSTLVSGSSRGS